MNALERAQRREAKGRLIRKLREGKGYSQQFTATAIRVSRSTIQKVEAGETGTEDGKFWEFLELVGITEAEFCHRLESELAGDAEKPVSEEEERINAELRASLSGISLHTKRILHSIFCRKWGGDPERLMDMAAVQYCLSLRSRLRRSMAAVQDFEIEREMGILQNAELEQPNIRRLDTVNKEKARAALLAGEEGYQ